MKVTGKRNRQNRHQGYRMMVHTRWHGTYSAPSDLFLSDGMLSSILQSRRWNISCLLHKALQERNNPKRNSSRRSPDTADQVTNLTFRFKGKPTAEQEAYFCQNIGNCRFLWNTMLGDYLEKGRFETPAFYKKQPGLDWLKEGDSLALANVQLNLQAAVHDYQSGEKGVPGFLPDKPVQPGASEPLPGRKPLIYAKTGRLRGDANNVHNMSPGKAGINEGSLFCQGAGCSTIGCSAIQLPRGSRLYCTFS